MIFDFQNAKIKQMIVHQIGSITDDLDNTYSETCVELPQNEEENMIPDLLKQYFLANFKDDTLFSFENPGENIVYRCATDVFSDTESFIENSKIIADHLLQCSVYPQIKQGEFYLVLFENIDVNNVVTQCLGIFKSENKETFLKIYPQDRSYEVSSEEGINIRKLDKGCLIFNTEPENGYWVSIVDKVSKNEAVFFKDKFLAVEPRQDSYFMTQNYMDLCKDFVKDVYNEESKVERIDQIDMLNRSFNFFKANKLFDEEKFNQEVLATPEVQTAFEEYKHNFENERGFMFNNDDNFTISDKAVKKQNSKFRSVIKLDRNFHIYVHGNHNFIQRGFDTQKGMAYYKLYFESEE